MTDSLQDASSQSTGTNPTGGKPEDGNTPSDQGTEGSQSDRPSTEELTKELETMKTNYSASSRQEQYGRQLAANQALEIQQLKSKIEESESQPAGGDFKSLDQIAKEMQDGIENSDSLALAKGLRNVLDIGRSEGRQEGKQQSKEVQDRQSRIQESAARINFTNLGNLEEPMTKRTWELYAQIKSAHQAGTFMSYVPNDEEMLAGTTIKINPHLLAEAQSRASAENPGAETRPAASGQVQIEGSGGGSPPSRRDTSISEGGPGLMSEAEKKTAETYFKKGDVTTEQAHQKFYKNLPANVRKVREKTGKLITTQDIIESSTAAAK